METERPPDVYVKTVLTFGDKPAPAMAQIALRKTAEEGEELYPEAAKVLKEDVYMDDNCHSEDSVQETRKIAEDLDKILKNGGFSVKNWISNEPFGPPKALCNRSSKNRGNQAHEENVATKHGEDLRPHWISSCAHHLHQDWKARALENGFQLG